MTQPSSIILDLETTGLHPPEARACDISIIDMADGATLVDTLMDPGIPIPAEATRIHSITDQAVQGKPLPEEIFPQVAELVREYDRLVIYNAAFDTGFFPAGFFDGIEVRCCMKRFARLYGEFNPWRGSYRWQKLHVAAAHVGHQWAEEDRHRALADCLATRSVWAWCEEQEQGAGRHTQEAALAGGNSASTEEIQP